MDTKRQNYILIDHENINSLDLGEIGELAVKVFIFIGEQSKKLPVDEVEKLLEHSGKIKLVRMAGHGKNALDFHIAFYAGRISVEDPKAFIHIISRDKGFDPLIAHLKGANVLARRSEKVRDIPIFHPPASTDERLQHVVKCLEKNAKARPRKRKKLISSIAALFPNQPTDQEIGDLIAALEKAGKLVIDEKETVIYQL